MSLRHALFTATLTLSLLAGCSRNATPPPTAEPSGTTAQPMESPEQKQPAPADAPVEGPSGGTTDTAPAYTPSAALPQGPAIFLLKGSGVRCMTTPCPTHLVSFPDAPDREPLQIHEVDLSGLGFTEEKQAELMAAVDSGQSVRVKASLSVRAKAGPAGDATVVRVLALVPETK
jgi:hypothetical protein